MYVIIITIIIIITNEQQTNKQTQTNKHRLTHPLTPTRYIYTCATKTLAQV